MKRFSDYHSNKAKNMTIAKIHIKKSPTADTRTCDWSEVSEEQLLKSSEQHINDVKIGLEAFKSLLDQASQYHDHDKLSNIKQFHHDFKTGFKETKWWDNHRKVNRHHLLAPDGVPSNVNLIDVIEMITDCVMAGKARSGSVYDINIPASILKRAFKNTVDLLEKNVIVGE